MVPFTLESQEKKGIDGGSPATSSEVSCPALAFPVGPPSPLRKPGHMNGNGNHHTFEEAVRKWIAGRQVNIYLKQRRKPLTYLTVCSISNAVWVCRWNGSTHLIPARSISYLRFPPDSDPYDHTEHPLHKTVKTGLRRTGTPAPVGIPAGLKDRDALHIGDLLGTLAPKKGG